MDISKKLSVKNGIADKRIGEYLTAEIRKKYTINDELAILRQRDEKPDEFGEYNEYVEACKAEIKAELGIITENDAKEKKKHNKK